MKLFIILNNIQYIGSYNVGLLVIFNTPDISVGVEFL